MGMKTTRQERPKPMAAQINIILKNLYNFSPVKAIEKLGLTLKARRRGYDNRTLLNMLLIATFLGQSLESIARFLKEIGAKTAVSADNLLRIIKRMTLDAIEMMINSILRDIVRQVWWKKRKAIIAIDLTDELYYGEKGKHVLKTKPRRGTHKAFRFLICSIVSKHGKFPIYVHIMREDEKLYEALKNAIRNAKRIVNIGTILLDRGFFSVKMLKMLRGMRYPFIMAVPATSKLKEMFEKVKKKVFRHTFRSKRYGTFTATIVVRVDEKKEPVFYAVYSEEMVRKPSDVHYAYRKRWRVEINNKMVKLHMAKTSSPDPRVRLFLFGFSCLVYSIWLASRFKMNKSALSRIGIPLTNNYYSVWSLTVAFQSIIALL